MAKKLLKVYTKYMGVEYELNVRPGTYEAIVRFAVEYERKNPNLVYYPSENKEPLW